MHALKRTAAALALSAAALGSARAEIKIGVAGPMTGPNAAYGQQYVNGVRAAADKINAAGGVLGQKLVVVTGDDVSDPRQGVTVANNFVADGVRFVVGHFNSGVTIPASDVYVENGVMFVTPTATNPKVTDRGLWNAFRACGRDDQQGSIAAKFVLDKFKDRKVAIVDDKSTAGKGLADEMRKGYVAGGGKPALSESINPGEKDYTALVSKLRSSGVDLLYYGGMHTEAGLLVRQMRDQGVKTVLMGGDGISNSEFALISGPGGAGTLMTSFPDPGQHEQAKAVVADLVARNVPREAVTFYAYAATQIVANAIAKAGKVDAKAAAAYLHSGAKVDTVLGPISYDKQGDIQQPGFVVFEWKMIDGKLVPAELR